MVGPSNILQYDFFSEDSDSACSKVSEMAWHFFLIARASHDHDASVKFFL